MHCLQWRDPIADNPSIYIGHSSLRPPSYNIKLQPLLFVQSAAGSGVGKDPQTILIAHLLVQRLTLCTQTLNDAESVTPRRRLASLAGGYSGPDARCTAAYGVVDSPAPTAPANRPPLRRCPLRRRCRSKQPLQTAQQRSPPSRAPRHPAAAAARATSQGLLWARKDPRTMAGHLPPPSRAVLGWVESWPVCPSRKQRRHQGLKGFFADRLRGIHLRFLFGGHFLFHLLLINRLNDSIQA